MVSTVLGVGLGLRRDGDEMTHQLNPPAEISLFLDRLHAAGQKVAERPMVWVEYKGRWVGVVEVEEAKVNADRSEAGKYGE